MARKIPDETLKDLISRVHACITAELFASVPLHAILGQIQAMGWDTYLQVDITVTVADSNDPSDPNRPVIVPNEMITRDLMDRMAQVSPAMAQTMANERRFNDAKLLQGLGIRVTVEDMATIDGTGTQAQTDAGSRGPDPTLPRPDPSPAGPVSTSPASAPSAGDVTDSAPGPGPDGPEPGPTRPPGQDPS
jgi:hypothetical protein